MLTWYSLHEFTVPHVDILKMLGSKNIEFSEIP